MRVYPLYCRNGYARWDTVTLAGENVWWPGTRLGPGFRAYYAALPKDEGGTTAIYIHGVAERPHDGAGRWLAGPLAVSLSGRPGLLLWDGTWHVVADVVPLGDTPTVEI